MLFKWMPFLNTAPVFWQSAVVWKALPALSLEMDTSYQWQSDFFKTVSQIVEESCGNFDSWVYTWYKMSVQILDENK